MPYILLIHVVLIIWIVIDGRHRKTNVFLWAVGTMILGPILLPQYLAKRPRKADQLRDVRKKYNFFEYLAVFWTILLAVVGIWGRKTATSIIKNQPLEYRLAVMNAGGNVRDYEATIDRFRSILDQLSQSCIENRQQISNISVIVHDKVKANGVNEPLINIMEGLSQLFWPDNVKKGSYSEYAFSYAGLRNAGLSHKEAIEHLQAVISGY